MLLYSLATNYPNKLISTVRKFEFHIFGAHTYAMLIWTWLWWRQRWRHMYVKTISILFQHEIHLWIFSLYKYKRWSSHNITSFFWILAQCRAFQNVCTQTHAMPKIKEEKRIDENAFRRLMLPFNVWIMWTIFVQNVKQNKKTTKQKKWTTTMLFRSHYHFLFSFLALRVRQLKVDVNQQLISTETTSLALNTFHNGTLHRVFRCKCLRYFDHSQGTEHTTFVWIT